MNLTPPSPEDNSGTAEAPLTAVALSPTPGGGDGLQSMFALMVGHNAIVRLL